MGIARRDLLKLAAGSAVGLAFTPVPWKLIGDSAKWTQNWRWNAVPPRGESRIRFTTCSLCPAGCAVRARCIGAAPVSLAGVAHHPASRGALCPLGIAGHHLVYHPLRLTEPAARVARNGQWAPIALDEAITQVAARIEDAQKAGKSVAILDERPGRALSDEYRRFLGATSGGLYVVNRPPEARTLAAVFTAFQANTTGQGSPGAAVPIGFDLEGARTILSVGAPLLDGWGTPGRMAGLLKRRNTPDAVRLIQAESCQSRTGSLADSWLPLRPGTELALVLGLANVLVGEKLYDARFVERNAADFRPQAAGWLELVARFDPDRAAAVTGVSRDLLIATARELAGQGPSLVIGGGDEVSGPLGREEETAIAGLNLLLGSFGRKGGVLLRREIPSGETRDRLAPPRELDSVPDGSIGVLIADGTSTGGAAWTAVRRKLDPQAAIISLSPYNDALTQRATCCVPAPGYTEAIEELATPPDAVAASLSLAVPLIPAPPKTVDPLEFLNKLAAATGVAGVAANSESAVKARAERIHQSGSGEVIAFADGKRTATREFKSAEDFWKALMEGAVWIDQPDTARSAPRFRFLPAADDARRIGARADMLSTRPDAGAAFPLLLVPSGWRGNVDSGRTSPLMTKLYQESDLRHGDGEIVMNPATAHSYGLEDGSPVRVETDCGACTATARLDPGIMPGVLQAALGGACQRLARDTHTASDLCAADARNTWRSAPAKLSRV